jgi:hypothetical protein
MIETSAYDDRHAIRFAFGAQKATAAIQIWVADHGLRSLEQVMAAFYLADRSHLNSFGRPVFGATYLARSHGPLPIEAYELARHEPIYLADVGIAQLPWRLDGDTFIMVRDLPPNLRCLSISDQNAISEASSLIKEKTTLRDLRNTVKGADWHAARLGVMRYEDMVNEGPDKEAIVDDLKGISVYVML